MVILFWTVAGTAQGGACLDENGTSRNRGYIKVTAVLLYMTMANMVLLLYGGEECNAKST